SMRLMIWCGSTLACNGPPESRETKAAMPSEVVILVIKTFKRLFDRFVNFKNGIQLGDFQQIFNLAPRAGQGETAIFTFGALVHIEEHPKRCRVDERHFFQVDDELGRSGFLKDFLDLLGEFVFIPGTDWTIDGKYMIV